MIKSFWQKLKKRARPILALAPLAGFTDSAFRQICKKYGADVLYSEMASATALYYSARGQGLVKSGALGISRNRKGSRSGKNVTLELLKFNRQKEKYYVVQLFGADPEHFAVAAQIISEKIKPDGIDINFGCPVPKVCRQGAGAALMKDLNNSRAVIEAVLANTDLPVSVKIRAKAGETDALKFLKNISDLPVSAVMIHGRTLSQGFTGASDFKIIKKVRQYFKGVILANGGINNLDDARRALEESGANGLGLARGVLGRPWLFKEIKSGRVSNLKAKEIFKIMLSQAAMVQKAKGKAGILELRKHLAWYAKGLPGAAKLREKLVKVESLAGLKKILSE